MSPECEVPDNDFWANDYNRGTSVTWTFVGTEGLARLSGPHLLAAHPASGFTAKLTRVQLDHVALEAFESSAHVATRRAPQIVAFPTPLFSLLIMVEGRASLQLAGVELELGSGECIAVDSRDEFQLSTAASSKMMRSVIGREHLPQELQRHRSDPKRLRRSVLLDSFIAFVASVLTTTASGRQARGDRLIQAIAELQSAVIAQAQQVDAINGAPAGLRYAMEEFIDSHYADPTLTPAVVAAVFGISLRTAHLMFNDDERTLARFIRDRRISAAALELRTSADSPRLSDVARRSGFINLDTFNRAFKERFAMTASEYRNGGHRHLG